MSLTRHRVSSTLGRKMKTFERYIPATKFRRIGAGFANALCLGIVIKIYEGLTARDANDAPFYFLCGAVVLASALFPESLGKRFCNLTILGVNKEEIGKWTRLIRGLPYILLAVSSALAVLIENETKVYVLGPVSIVSYLFILLNGISALIIPSGLSIMDMLLKTQVMAPPPLTESLKPTFFGLKIR
jgi:uncharacterized RDD family membrane protein YckC